MGKSFDMGHTAYSIPVANDSFGIDSVPQSMQERQQQAMKNPDGSHKTAEQFNAGVHAAKAKTLQNTGDARARFGKQKKEEMSQEPSSDQYKKANRLESVRNVQAERKGIFSPEAEKAQEKYDNYTAPRGQPSDPRHSPKADYTRNTGDRDPDSPMPVAATDKKFTEDLHSRKSNGRFILSSGKTKASQQK